VSGAGGVGDEYELPGVPWVSGSGQVAYAGGSWWGGTTGISALNMTTGSVLWTGPVAGQVAAALDGGRVAVGAPGSPTTVLGPDGTVVASNQPSFLDWSSFRSGLLLAAPLFFAGDTWIGSSGPAGSSPGLSPEDGRFGAVVATPAYLDPGAGFPLQSGRELKNNAASKVGRGLFAKGHSVVAVADVGYRHVSIRLVPTHHDLWRQQRPDAFSNQDEHGNWFATLGAGPVPDGCSGMLVSAGVQTGYIGNRINREHG